MSFGHHVERVLARQRRGRCVNGCGRYSQGVRHLNMCYRCARQERDHRAWMDAERVLAEERQRQERERALRRDLVPVREAVYDGQRFDVVWDGYVGLISG